MIEEKRCFIYKGRAFDTREEAEEAMLKSRRELALNLFMDWLHSRRDYVPIEQRVKKLESLGFFHDGAERE